MHEFWRSYLRQRGAILWCCVIVLLGVMALMPGLFTSADPTAVVLDQRLQSPSFQHPFGTDNLGRDLLSRTLHGGRVSLSIGVISRALAIMVGVVLGMMAGYAGGWIDWLICRLVDSTLAFPSLLLAIGIAFFLGPGYLTLLISLTVVSWAPVARLVRTASVSVRNETYIEAARAANASHFRIVFQHILPNVSPVVVVAFTSGIATAILGESSLSFLGLGPEPSIPTWGQMISVGLKDIFSPPPGHPWLYLFPGSFLFLAVLAFNISGDLVRDTLDPRLRETG